LNISAKGASSPRERAEPTDYSGITISIFFQPVVRTRAFRKEIVMSDSPSRLPARPSLEQLHKQAKDLLRQYRAGESAALGRFRAAGQRPGDPSLSQDASLAGAQFVIAREYGFETWAKLKHHIEAVRPPGMEQCKRLAKDLAAAYTSGDAMAIREVNWNYGTSFDWDSRGADFTLADAERMVAQSYGFEGWAQLAESFTQPPGDPRSVPLYMSSTPPFYKIDWKDNTISVVGPQSEKDWDTIFGVMKEHHIARLSAGGMTDTAMERLSQLDHVTHLHIGGSKTLTDEGVSRLARMPQLRDLVLGGPTSPITDRGLEALRHLTELRRFQMCWTQGISDTGLANLACCDHLESVNLLGTPTGDGAIQALAGKRHLRRFRTGHGVTDAGLGLCHQFPIFKTWHGGEIKYGLMSAEAEPNHLLIDGPFTNAGLATLAGLEGLFGLTFFWHCPAFTSAGLESLKQLPNLGFLGCQGEHCDDQAMRHVAAIPRLRMLMGQGAVASDEGFLALSHSQTIEYIWGRECPNLGGRGFAALAEMPALRGIAVSCKNVDDASLSALPHFPALRDLMPMDVPDEGFRHVGRCEYLEGLWCMYCRETGDAATQHIAGLSRLKTYYAGKTRITDRSLEILGRMASLERLEFWQCAGLTEAGMAYLAGLPRLREITLDGLPNVTREAVALFPAQVRVSYAG
jgi:hypothetical protein